MVNLTGITIRTNKNKIKKAEEKSASGSENLTGAEVAETGPPKKLL